MGDNSKNPTIQKMTRARYIISEPPRMMRNISKYYTAKNVQNRQVLKFDIRNADPSRQLWNRREESSEHADQERLIETADQIQGEENKSSSKTQKNEHCAKKYRAETASGRNEQVKGQCKNVGQEKHKATERDTMGRNSKTQEKRTI